MYIFNYVKLCNFWGKNRGRRFLEMSQSAQPRHITFYIGTQHVDFREQLRPELDKLEKRNIGYHILSRSNRIMPRVCIDGYCVAGISLIRDELKSVLSAR